jgi:hypothetical protein
MVTFVRCGQAAHKIYMKNPSFTIAMLLFSATLAAPSFARAQDNMSIGGLVSASSYIGDFNPGGAMKRPGAYVGSILHYAFSEYYNVRVGLGAGNLRGDPSTYEGRLMSNVSYQKPVEFNQLFFDADARLEAGFLPYNPLGFDPKRLAFSPYFALGVGMAYSNGAPLVQLPVAVGAKYRIIHRFTLGAELTLRKTFSDGLDGWENVKPSPGRTLNNNDWISYVGVYLTYQLSEKGCCHENESN